MEEYKILLAGSDGVGKTTWFKSVTGKLLDISYLPTLAVNIDYKKLEFRNKQVGFCIWDIGGQAYLRQFWRDYYPETDGCILMYDITRKYTFDDISAWKQELEKYTKKGIPFILVGNKLDLESERIITYQEGDALKNEIKAIKFFETSALFKTNVKEVFEQLASSLNKNEK